MIPNEALANNAIANSNTQDVLPRLRYNIQTMEDQIIYQLQSDTNLSAVNIASHAGQITALFFQDAYLKEGLLKNLPFIFVQYQGKSKVDHDSVMGLDIVEIRFRFFIAAQSLRSTKEAQVSCYSMLASLYENIHGKNFHYAGNLITEIPQLNAPLMTVIEMNQQSPLTEANATIEQLIVNLPDVVVYQTDYVCSVLA